MTQTISLAFYTPGAESSPHPRLIDVAMRQPDGQLKGLYTDKNQQEMQAAYGCEILLADVQTVTDLVESSHVTLPTPTTEQEFLEALEALPPLKWGRWLRVESFRMSEFYSGTITRIYARTEDGRYWTFLDKAFMSGEELARKVLAAAHQLQPA